MSDDRELSAEYPVDLPHELDRIVWAYATTPAPGDEAERLGYAFDTVAEARPEALEGGVAAWLAAQPNRDLAERQLLRGIFYPSDPYRLPDAVMRAVLRALTGEASERAFEWLIPPKLATAWDVRWVQMRTRRATAEIDALPPEERVNARSRLLAAALDAFEPRMLPGDDVPMWSDSAWGGPEPLGSHTMRRVLGPDVIALVRSIIADASVASASESDAALERMWDALEGGWLSILQGLRHDRYDLTPEVAALARSPGFAEAFAARIERESAHVSGKAIASHLRFWLLVRAVNEGAPMALLEAAIPQGASWEHRKVVVDAYVASSRPEDAVRLLEASPSSAQRDRELARVLAASGKVREAARVERASPSRVKELAESSGVTSDSVTDAALDALRPGEGGPWLAKLVAAKDWKRAQRAAMRAHPDAFVVVLGGELPPKEGRALALKAIERVLSGDTTYIDAPRAKEVARAVWEAALALSPDAKSRAQLVRQARTRVNRVIAKSTDFFLRELAFDLDAALAEHEDQG